MTNDLIDRARKVAHTQEHIIAIGKMRMGATIPAGHDEDVLNTLNDCADALEARDARIAELEGAQILNRTAIGLQRSKRETAEARVKVLEDALRFYAGGPVDMTGGPVNFQPGFDNGSIARAALEGEK